MPKEVEYLDARYTVFMPTKEIDNWKIDEFIIIKSFPCLFNEEYSIAEIESVALTSEAYTAEDVMDITGALAVHEEYTNGVLMTPETVDEINDVYCWNGGGTCFIGDMLTEIERLSVLIKHLYTTYKTLIKVEDLSYNIDKDSPYKPLADNVDILFSNEVNCIQYKDHHPETLWWPYMIEECGFYIIILDCDLDDEEDDNIPVKTPDQLSLLPSTNCNPNSSRDPWDDYDDDYDSTGYYMTEYYRQRGYI